MIVMLRQKCDIPRLIWSTIGVLGVVAVCFLFGGCDFSTEQMPAPQDNSSSKSSVPQSTVFVSGTVVAISDISGYQANPYSSGSIFIVPEASLADFQKMLPQLPGPLTASVESDSGITLTLIDKNGEFLVALAPGTYAFALANLGQSHPDPTHDPATIYGWTILDVPYTETHRIQLRYDGEARQVTAE